MLIHLICAARPNFMKLAPLYHALKKEDWAQPVIVHTGQHYDANMSDAFFQDLGLPEPDIHLGVGSGSHAEQTGKILIAYEKILREHRPDLVVVIGDVNSTMAATLAAVKMGIKVAHLEAGLRSFDRTMPEEINRIVTDALADMLWVPSRDAVENLIREGVSPARIHLVGNVMIDSLEILREKIVRQKTFDSFGLEPGKYGVVTLHRPSNVDNPETLKKMFSAIAEISPEASIVFPLHPRTLKKAEEYNLLSILEKTGNIYLPGPLSYIRFMNLVFNSSFVITDSGGIQEETSYLGIPCLTVRKNTERPITVTRGTNRLCEIEDLYKKATDILRGSRQKPASIEFWDGKTAKRVVSIILSLCGNGAHIEAGCGRA